MNQNSKQLVLVVDDRQENLRLMQSILGADGYQVELATDGVTALQKCKALAPNLILLDVLMPDMDGYEVCRQLKEDEAARHIPVIFLTALNEAVDVAKGFALGAVDFVHKPISVPVLLARVRMHLAQYGQRRSLEGMFQDVIEFAPDAFVLADMEGTVVRVNTQAERLFGYSRHELVGLPVEMLIPAPLRSSQVANRKAYAEKAHSLKMGASVPCLRKDGTVFPGDINLSPLHTHHGSLLMVVVRDVTERQQREDLAQEAARYARSLIEVSPDPLIMIDTLGNITDVNIAAERITGLGREDMTGSKAASIFTEPQRLHEAFRQVIDKGHLHDYRMTMQHVSGKLTEVMCNANVYRNQQGEVIGIFASARDMTESRRIQQEILESRQRVRELAAQSEAVREEEKKHIAREVHDELGQVLTALRMDLSFLGMQSGAQDPALMAKLQGMKGLVDRAIQGVRNVASSLRPAALDMGLQAAIDWLCAEFTRRTQIPCALHADASAIDLDEVRAMAIFRIVQESLTNVARYAQASQIDITMERRGSLLCLEVRDNGRGFDPAEVGKRKSYGLLGMRERAIVLGGKVKIVSAPGQGTRVNVRIPVDDTLATKDLT